MFRAQRQSLASLIVGLVVGCVGGLFLGARVHIESDQWWSLAGSAMGAFVAIAGGVWLFHYQQNVSGNADRIRIATQIDSALKQVAAFNELWAAGAERYPDLEAVMWELATEYDSINETVQRLKHTSAEISRASTHLYEGFSSQLKASTQLGGVDKLSIAAARSGVEELESSLVAARRALKA